MSSLTEVAPGDLATIVTTLEMRQRPRPAPIPDSPLRLMPWQAPAPDKYRALFRRIGTPWLWYSRLAMSEAALTGIIHDPAVRIFAALDRAGIEVGMLELDFRQKARCEIVYLGLISELAGGGHGRWLMANALALAWQGGTELVWVHTCTLDHHSALNFYRKQGFIATKRTIETFPDPRLLGLLPPESAPQIPCFAADSRR